MPSDYEKEGQVMDIDEPKSIQLPEETKGPPRHKKTGSYIERSKQVGRIGPLVTKLDQ